MIFAISIKSETYRKLAQEAKPLDWGRQIKDCAAFTAAKPAKIRQKETVILKARLKGKKKIN